MVFIYVASTSQWDLVTLYTHINMYSDTFNTSYKDMIVYTHWVYMVPQIFSVTQYTTCILSGYHNGLVNGIIG